MVPINDQKARQVWSRVMQSGGAAGQISPENRTDSPAPSGEKSGAASGGGSGGMSGAKAAEFWASAKQAAADYRRLSRCAPKSAERLLLQMARDEDCNARRLAALHYLLTGQRPCRTPCPSQPISCFHEAIRLHYQQVLAAQRLYGTLAGQDGPWQELFQSLTNVKARHARQLYCILQQTL